MLGHSFRRICAAGLVLACAACASTPVRPDAGPPDAGHTYYLIGLEPADVALDIAAGNVVDGTFVLPLPYPRGTNDASATDGFIFGEARSGQTLGVVSVVFGSTWNLDGVWRSVPCGKALTLVFQTPAGKVIYLTHMRVRNEGGGGAQVFHHAHFDAAKAFLAKYHPQLAASLEQGHFDFLPASC